MLHVKADADEYLEPMRLEAIVRKWADHITLPITIARDGKDQPANEGTALWRKPRAEISEQSYTEFYRHLGHLFDTRGRRCTGAPRACWSFSRLLFVPGMKPFEPFEDDRESHVKLHVRRMFITDKAELLPPWLRFVQGVVDTEDLPLNVSREMLQTTPVLGAHPQGADQPGDDRAEEPRARTPTITRSSGTISARHEGGRVGGLRASRRDRPAAAVPLLDAGGLDLAGGLSGAHAAWAGHDLYLAGDNIDALKTSPQLEGFRAKGIEVLLLSDPIDAFWPERLDSFEGKQLSSVTQAAGEDRRRTPTCRISRRCWPR